MSRPYIYILRTVPRKRESITAASIYVSVPGTSSNAHQNMPTYHYKYFSFYNTLHVFEYFMLLSEIRYLQYIKKYAI